MALWHICHNVEKLHVYILLCAIKEDRGLDRDLLDCHIDNL